MDEAGAQWSEAGMVTSWFELSRPAGNHENAQKDALAKAWDILALLVLHLGAACQHRREALDEQKCFP